MRKVVLPTDFSESAWNALHYAMELFKYDITEWYLMHAFADEVYENNAINVRAKFDELKAQVQAVTEKQLEEWADKIKHVAANPKHSVKTIAAFGSLVDAVNDLVEDENIDLVVMGTQGATGKKELTFGTQTLQVIKYVKCPVLAIPNKFHEMQPTRVLFPTDYLVPYKRRELKLLSTLAKNFTTKITLLYVSKFDKRSFRQEDNKQFLVSCLEENQCEEIQLKEDDVTWAIHDFMEKTPVDFLVMVNSRHSYLEHVLHTSKIEKMSLGSQIPFLVLQNLPR